MESFVCLWSFRLHSASLRRHAGQKSFACWLCRSLPKNSATCRLDQLGRRLAGSERLGDNVDFGCISMCASLEQVDVSSLERGLPVHLKGSFFVDSVCLSFEVSFDIDPEIWISHLEKERGEEEEEEKKERRARRKLHGLSSCSSWSTIARLSNWEPTTGGCSALAAISELLSR